MEKEALRFVNDELSEKEHKEVWNTFFLNPGYIDFLPMNLQVRVREVLDRDQVLYLSDSDNLY